MLGAAGVLFPELLKGAGLGGPAAATAWYEAGAYNYSIGSAKSLFGLQMLLNLLLLQRYLCHVAQNHVVDTTYSPAHKWLNSSRQ